MEAGNRVPADCILIEEMNVTADESIYGNGNKVSKNLSKEYDEPQQYDPDGDGGIDGGMIENNHKYNPDPFLLAESKVLTG